MIPRVARAALCALLLLLPACAKKDGFPVHPVSGKVTVKGQPLEGVMVVLHPAGETKEKYANVRPVGYTDTEGKFTLTTYTAGDGAPEGEWHVTALMKPKDDEGDDQPSSKAKLDWKFARPDTSDLKTTVKPGSNTIEPIYIP